MSKKKDVRVYKRKEHNGVEYLLLAEDDILKQLDLEWVRSDDDLRQILDMLHDYENTAAKWFWIETGVPVTLVKRQEGFTWLVPDERKNSMNYKWLRGKAEKYENKIIETINKYGESIKEFLGDVVQEEEEQTEEGEDSDVNAQSG